jgi:RNA polymerase sigma-70 factor (ECF subfamily)
VDAIEGAVSPPVGSADPVSRLVDISAPSEPADRLAILAAAARQGHAGATRTLIVSVTPALLRVVRGVLGVDHPECEDLVQEAAFGFIRALPSFRDECSVLHFACRVAVLTALGARRRMRARGESHVERLGDLAAEPEPPGGARRREIVRELCGTLPEAQSEALIMHCVLGFSVEEVASASGAPPNTVRSRLRLAKEALRARIEADPILKERLEVGE